MGHTWKKGNNLPANSPRRCREGAVCGHRDVIGGRAGLFYKQSFVGLNYAELFHHALRDFPENHAAHIAHYLAH